MFLADLLPMPEHGVDWAAIEAALAPHVRAMSECAQDPEHHPEGDVWTHTRMVVEELLKPDAFWALSEEERLVLFGAALLHDVGKPVTTRIESESVVAPNHARIGSIIARNFLWEKGVDYNIREAICGLVRWHMVPGHILDRPNPEEMALRLSIVTQPRLLRILAEADARGRSGKAGTAAAVDRLDLFTDWMKDMGVWDGPFPFANDHSRFEYFCISGRNPHYAAYENTRSVVTYMSGLPASGKDTWIAANRSGLPVVSRDQIREELGVKFGTDEGKVSAVQNDRLRELLRAGEDFVFNTTGLSREIRALTMGLMAAYNARIEIVYVETTLAKLTERNNGRREPVPAAAIEKMRRRWEIPDLTEAHTITTALN